MEKPSLHQTISWPEEFFNGFTALPVSETVFSLTTPKTPKSFDGNILKIVDPIRFNKEHPISVWHAKTNKQDLAVKNFCPVEEEQIKEIIRTYPGALNNSIERVKRDYDPFILEQRAYERIDQLSPEKYKAYFPKYYGLRKDRSLVIEMLRPSLRSRCICSNSIPDYLINDLQVLQEENIGKNLSLLEQRWYESLFIDRLKRLTALHSIGTTHGDIKEDHFRLEDDFYDTVLFDFSLAYTITPERPYMVQGHVIDSRNSVRWAAWRSMQKLVELERKRVRGLINTRIQKNDFNLRYELNDEDYLMQSHFNEKELIAMRVYREPEEFAFPSLASILPFFEEVGNPKIWLILRASSLEDYVALWIESYDGNADPCLIAMVSSSGEKLCSYFSAGTVKAKKYYLFLIPKFWLEELKISREFISKILSVQTGKQKVWIVSREDSFAMGKGGTSESLFKQ